MLQFELSLLSAFLRGVAGHRARGDVRRRRRRTGGERLSRSPFFSFPIPTLPTQTNLFLLSHILPEIICGKVGRHEKGTGKDSAVGGKKGISGGFHPNAFG